MSNDRPSEQPETEPRGLGCTAVVMPCHQCQRLKLLAVKASSLIMSIENRHDLHAIFTVKDSPEFYELRAAVNEVVKA